MKSLENGKFVTARNAGADALSAEVTGIAGWELFELIDHSDGTVSFKALCNGKFVSVRFNDDYHPLVAMADTIDLWEKFVVEETNGTQLIKTAKDGFYVQADILNDGVLRAKETKADTWERFELFDQEDQNVETDFFTREFAMLSRLARRFREITQPNEVGIAPIVALSEKCPMWNRVVWASGGHFFWETIAENNGWKLQRNKFFKQFRVRDPHKTCRACGWMKTMRLAFFPKLDERVHKGCKRMPFEEKLVYLIGSITLLAAISLVFSKDKEPPPEPGPVVAKGQRLDGGEIDQSELDRLRTEIRRKVATPDEPGDLEDKCDLIENYVNKHGFPASTDERNAIRAVEVARRFLSDDPYQVTIRSASRLPNAHRTRLEFSNLGPRIKQRENTEHLKACVPEWNKSVSFRWKPGDRIRIEWLWSSHWAPNDTTIGTIDCENPWTALLDALGGVNLKPVTGIGHVRLNGNTPFATLVSSEFPDPRKDAKLFERYIAPGTYWQAEIASTGSTNIAKRVVTTTTNNTPQVLTISASQWNAYCEDVDRDYKTFEDDIETALNSFRSGLKSKGDAGFEALRKKLPGIAAKLTSEEVSHLVESAARDKHENNADHRHLKAYIEHYYLGKGDPQQPGWNLAAHFRAPVEKIIVTDGRDYEKKLFVCLSEFSNKLPNHRNRFPESVRKRMSNDDLNVASAPELKFSTDPLQTESDIIAKTADAISRLVLNSAGKKIDEMEKSLQNPSKVDVSREHRALVPVIQKELDAIVSGLNAKTVKHASDAANTVADGYRKAGRAILATAKKKPPELGL